MTGIIITRGSRIYVNPWKKFHCEFCGANLFKKITVSRPRRKKVCILCAVRMEFVTEQELAQFAAEYESQTGVT